MKITKSLSLVALTGSSLKPADVRGILLKEGVELCAVSASPSGRSVCSVLDAEQAEHAVRVLHSNVIT